MAVAILFYGSETCILRCKSISKIQAAEMMFLRSVKGCTRLDGKRNDSIRQDFNSLTIEDKINQYHKEWWEYVNRMEDTRLLKLALHYTDQQDGVVWGVSERDRQLNRNKPGGLILEADHDDIIIRTGESCTSFDVFLFVIIHNQLQFYCVCFPMCNLVGYVFLHKERICHT